MHFAPATHAPGLFSGVTCKEVVVARERTQRIAIVGVADSVMYREALATAAQARGWSVHWYDREHVFRDAAAALGREDVDAFLRAMGRSIGPQWQARHKLAAAAALEATGHTAFRLTAG
jgi:hypothetical protein